MKNHLRYIAQKIIIGSLLIGAGAIDTYAQAPFQLKIKLLSDTGNEVISFTRVSLVTPDKKVIASSITDINGVCLVNLPDTLEHPISIFTKPIGFGEYSSLPVSFKAMLSDTIRIRLTKTNTQLREITIFQPRIIVSGDKLIYNVKQDKFSAGTSASELFPLLPGVSFSSNGGVKLNGKEGVVILIDGSGELKSVAQQMAILSNLSSDQIESIEIISSPPARYDASVKAIINIITKK